MASPPGKRGSGKPRGNQSNSGGPRPVKPAHGKPAGPKKPLRSGPPKSGPPKRRPRPAAASSSTSREPREGDRLQKVLAAAGLSSRRGCEELITEGRVQVDGEIVTELGARVDRARQEIKVDGEPLPRTRLQYFAVHKPVGVVSTARDPSGRPRVIDLLPPGVGRLFNVGRLDMASEGLILVTNDGLLANQLTHPRHGIEKIYEVLVAGQPAADVLAQVKRGVHLSEGYVHAVDVRVKSSKKGATLLEMVLDEGRNREIRRLLARLGHKVQRLTRIAVGPVRLGDLPRGAVRPLTHEEVKKLKEVIAAGPKPEMEETASAPRSTRFATGRVKRPSAPGGKRPAPGGAKRPATSAGAKPMGRKPPMKPKRAVPSASTEPMRAVIGDDGSSPVPARKPAAKPSGQQQGGKPPGKRPGRPGAFKKKSGPQRGQGGKPRGGKR